MQAEQKKINLPVQFLDFLHNIVHPIDMHPSPIFSFLPFLRGLLVLLLAEAFYELIQQ